MAALTAESSRPLSTKRLKPLLTITDNPAECFCVRFSPDGKFLAAGCGDGAIRVFNSSTGRLAHELRAPSGEGLPTTAIRFRPLGASKTKNVLLAANSDGSVNHWHITSGKCLHSIKDENNQLYCIDYKADGSCFATAGKDYTVRVYDEATKTLVTEMCGGLGKVTPGHSNRVFSLKFNPADPNVLISGGWDNTVQIWDLRVEHAVRSIYGPHVCGDSVDIHGNTILTGSWRPQEQLETWDYATGNKAEDISWHQSVVHSSDPAMVYACQFSKNAELIAAGGSGTNEARVFDRTASNALVGTVSGLSRAVFTLDFSPDDKKLAVAGGDAAIRILEIGNKPPVSSTPLWSAR